MRRDFPRAIVFIFFITLPSAVMADCVEYENYIKWVGQNRAVGGLSIYEKDIVISGTMAYVATGASRALQVVDISNPSSPQLVGSVFVATFGGVVTGLTVQGSIAYVTAAQTGLVIVNVANPAAPTILKTVDTPGVAEDVVVSGSYAYVADYSSGLQVVNISNPAMASIVGTVDTPGNAFGVSLNGSVLYLADEYFGLQVINIANPLAPLIIGTRDTPGNAQDLRSVGSMVYVADAQSGIEVINASTPTSPVIVGHVDTPGYAWDLALSGNLAYVADGDSGLQIVDISNPVSPLIVGHKGSPGTNVDRAVAISGSFAYVVENGAGQYEANYGLQVIDVSHLASVEFVGTAPLSYYPFALTVSGPWAYVADESLEVFDVSNPYSPVRAAKAGFPGLATDVVLSGTKAYVGTIRFTPPAGPAYGGVGVVDVSNPAAPQVQGFVELAINDASRTTVAVSGTTAFFGDEGRFVTVDVSDPNHPSVLGILSGFGGGYGYISGIAVSGPEAYVAANDPFANNSSLYKINISNLAAPTVIGSLLFPAVGSGRVTLSGGLVYVAVIGTSSSGADGFRVVAVTSPGAPTLVGSMNLAGRTESLALQGGILYAASQEGGIQVVDVSNPAQPQLLGGADIDDYAMCVAVSGSWAYVGINPPRLSVYPLECLAGIGIQPEDPEQIGVILGQAVPNPTLAGSTTIPFSMPARNRAKLRILDISGREVRVLADQVFDAGERSVTWDGRNDNGHLVPGGIYFYQFQGPGSELTRKLVRIR